ncbi:MAG: PAS domain-containing protein [Helicobacteraceae bacterium]|nr:PAS domain-containing protein [Helicobacteraceae bacterium]
MSDAKKLQETIDKETYFGEEEIFISYTDLDGAITYGNDVFIRTTGYTNEELIGQNHSIIRHPDMPRLIFKLLWDFMLEGSLITSYIKNRAKDGSYYWVCATVFGVKNSDLNVEKYISIRIKPTSKYFPIIQELYKELLECEKTFESSWEIECTKLLDKRLLELGFSSYEKLVQEITNEEFLSKEEILNISFDTSEIETTTEIKNVINIVDVLYNELSTLTGNIGNIKEILDFMVSNTTDITTSLRKTHLSSYNSAIMSSKLGELGRAFSVISHGIQDISTNGNRLSDAIDSNVSKMSAVFVEEEQLFTRTILIKMILILIKIEIKEFLQNKSTNLTTIVDAKNFLQFQMRETNLKTVFKELQSNMTQMSMFSSELKALSSVGKIECARIKNSAFISILGTIDEVINVIDSASKKSDLLVAYMKEEIECINSIFTEVSINGDVLSLYIMAYQHEIFVEDIRSTINTKEFKLLPTFQSCEFGKFYYSDLLKNVKKLNNIAAFGLYLDIETPHKKVHSLAQQAIELAQQSDQVDQLSVKMIQLESEKNRVMKLINNLIDSIKTEQ